MDLHKCEYFTSHITEKLRELALSMLSLFMKKKFINCFVPAFPWQLKASIAKSHKLSYIISTDGDTGSFSTDNIK
jgi:hypothetical protein